MMKDIQKTENDYIKGLMMAGVALIPGSGGVIIVEDGNKRFCIDIRHGSGGTGIHLVQPSARVLDGVKGSENEVIL